MTGCFHAVILLRVNTGRATVGKSAAHECNSSYLSLRCLCGLHNCLDSCESLFPHTDLLLDCLPLLQFDFAEHVTLNYDHFVLLVNLCINDLVLDCLDSPEFNLFHLNLSAQEKTVSKCCCLEKLS